MFPLPPMTFFAPFLLLAVALMSAFRPGRRPGSLPRIAEGAALAALALSVAGIVQLLVAGPSTFALGGGAGLIAFRLDPVSVTLAALVAFVGWIVVRY